MWNGLAMVVADTWDPKHGNAPAGNASCRVEKEAGTDSYSVRWHTLGTSKAKMVEMERGWKVWRCRKGSLFFLRVVVGVVAIQCRVGALCDISLLPDVSFGPTRGPAGQK